MREDLKVTTLKEREREELITIYQLMNNLEEMDILYLILKRKEFEGTRKNLFERVLLFFLSNRWHQ